MKKTYIIIALFVFCGITTAQTTFTPGVRAGMNFSKFTNSETDFKSDFYIGGLLAIKFSKIYTLQPELIYSRQGASAERIFDPTNFVNQTSTVNFSLDYLAVGAISKFTFGKGFQAVVGPSVDFKLNDNFSKYDLRNPIGFDLAFVTGVGYAFNNLTVEARFKQGLVDIFGDNYNTNVDQNNNGNYDEIILNQLFQIGVSYTFNFKK